MVRFSKAALWSALSLPALGASAAAATTKTTKFKNVDLNPPVGHSTTEIHPTSTILLDKIRDALLPDEEGGGNDERHLRQDRKLLERRRLIERSLALARLHPRSALDEPSLVSHLPPNHRARSLIAEHNSLASDFEQSRSLSRFEVQLRRKLGLFPFGDLDAEGALDGGRVGYGPLGHLGLVGDGRNGGDEAGVGNEEGGRRRLQDPPGPPPQQPGQPEQNQPPPQPGQPGQPGQPEQQPGQPGGIPEPGMQPGQPQPGQPSQPGQPGQPGDVPGQPGGVPGEPGQPGDVPGQPGGQPGGVPDPGVGDPSLQQQQEELPPPPPPLPGDVVPPVPPEAGGQPGLEAPQMPQPGAPGVPGEPGEPGVPGVSEVPGVPEVPGVEGEGGAPPPQPGQPGEGTDGEVVGMPQPGQPEGVPGQPGQPEGVPGQPGQPTQPGQPAVGAPVPIDALGEVNLDATAPPPFLNMTQQQQPGEQQVPGQPTSPTAGGADPSMYVGAPGPVVGAALNQTQDASGAAGAGAVPEPGQQPPEGGGPLGQIVGQTQPGQPGDATAATVTAAPSSNSPTAGPTDPPTGAPVAAPTTSTPTTSPTFHPTDEDKSLPAETPPDVVLPPDAPPDAALPPGHESGEILTGGLLDTYQTVPLLQGYGTHYSTVWVGSPEPQRVSVIVDTGSHFTAFPCRGCKNCGEEHHTDDYFDPAKSTTYAPLQCDGCSDGASCQPNNNVVALGLPNGTPNKLCTFGQSYTEGSSWRAYQAKDRFFCGGPDPSDAHSPVDNSYAIDFMFGCQISETGLFVGQLADGIMGMAAHRATLVKNMYDQGKLTNLMFGMCFRRELDASKEGVTAGVMTMGGVDSRLERTPMVYASNKVKDGWFTVYVKAIYLREGGGQSAMRGGGRGGPFGDGHAEEGGPAAPGTPGSPGTQPPVKVDMNPGVINSGKGVIVDSGTTDTYFNRALGVTFNREWKKMTGKDHNNSAMKLTREELLRLPTLLVQLEAYDDEGSGAEGTAAETFADSDPGSATPAEMGEESSTLHEYVPGTASAVDPARPNDVLLAIPATHYMEYSPKDDSYTSRLYFSESSGGVLGANAMMGHDVLFDWENGRVGFSESNCNFRDVVSVTEEHEGTEEGGDLSGNDCRLSVPTLKVGCVQTVDMGKCGTGDDYDAEAVLTGTEKWTMVVENPGTPSGMSCEEVLLRLYALEDVEDGNDPPTVSCDGNGLCYSIKPCEMSCAEAQTMSIAGTEPVPMDDDEIYNSGIFYGAGGGVGGDGGEDQRCANDLWGACEYSCVQSRIVSTFMSDGDCHETSREERECHIDACGREDPCRVPFVVHAILAFRGANAPLFTGRYRERFVEAFASAVNMNRVGKDELFGPGDVKVLMANHWYEDDDESGGNAPVGMKIVVEISIFNPGARLPADVVYEPVAEESPQDVSPNATDFSDEEAEGLGEDVVEEERLDTLHAMISAVKNAWNNLGGPPKATCDESDLYPLSRTALHVHMELERATFMKELIIIMKEYGSTAKGGGQGGGHEASAWSDPFTPTFKTQSYADESAFLSSWTIKTEIGGGTFHDHSSDLPSRGFNKDYALYFLQSNAQPLLIALAVLLCVCCTGICCGRSCARRRYERHATALMERLASMEDERKRGKYAKVGTGGAMDEGDMSDDEEGEFNGGPTVEHGTDLGRHDEEEAAAAQDKGDNGKDTDSNSE